MTYNEARKICFEMKPNVFDSEIRFLDNKTNFQLKIRIQSKCVENLFSVEEIELMNEDCFQSIVGQLLSTINF